MTNQVFRECAEDYYWKMETVSLGMSYDIMSNVVLKFQYDRQERAKERLDVLSTAVNFVF